MRCGHDDVAAVASIPTVRASTRNKHLPPETADAVSTTTGSYGDMYFIDKHNLSTFHRWVTPVPADEKVYPTVPEVRGEFILCDRNRGGRKENQDLTGTGYTLTFRLPRPPSNLTTPLILANKVWSLPRSTLNPGKNLVPRWRTIM